MSKQILDKDKEEGKFVNFLLNNEFVINNFIEEANNYNFILDYSVHSIEILELYYLKREPELTNNEESKVLFVEAASRYLGETVINNYGGAWTLAIDDPKDVYYGLPVIIGHSAFDVAFCAHETFRRFTRQKKTGLLMKVIKSQINPEKLSLIPEE